MGERYVYKYEQLETKLLILMGVFFGGIFFVYIYVITICNADSAYKQWFLKVNLQSPEVSLEQNRLILNLFFTFSFLVVFFFFSNDFLFRNLYQPNFFEFSLITIVLVSTIDRRSMRNFKRPTKIK